MFTMLKMVLIGTCLLGTAGTQITKPQILMNTLVSIMKLKAMLKFHSLNIPIKLLAEELNLPSAKQVNVKEISGL